MKNLQCEYPLCGTVFATKRGAFTLCTRHHIAVGRARGDGEILRGPVRARTLVIEKTAKMRRIAQKVFKRSGPTKSNEQIRTESAFAAVSERVINAVMPDVFRVAPGLREIAATTIGQMVANLLTTSPQPVTTIAVDARWDDFMYAWYCVACKFSGECPP